MCLSSFIIDIWVCFNSMQFLFTGIKLLLFPKLSNVQATESSLQCREALTELLLVIKLFVRLAESRASIGHDLMRVKQVGEQCETEAGADALDLACQVTDALCRMQRPCVELLGMAPVLLGLRLCPQDLAHPSYLLVNCKQLLFMLPAERKEKLTLFNDDYGSLLRRQPRARCYQHISTAFDVASHSNMSV